MNKTAENVFTRTYEGWKGLPLIPKIITALGAAGMVTSAATAAATLTAYLVNKRWTRRKAADAAHVGLNTMIGGTSTVAPYVPRTDYGGFEAQGSLSATGPGFLAGHENFPLRLKGDVGGGGVMWKFHPEKVSRWLERAGLMPEADEDVARTYLPPEMYAGIELSPFPIATGVAFDRGNLEETLTRLRRVRAKLRPYTKAGDYEAWKRMEKREDEN